MKIKLLVTILFILTLNFSYSIDTVKTIYGFVEPDSIPQAYFCVVLNDASINAKYWITYNNQTAYVDFKKSNYYTKRPKRWARKIFGENYRAFIIFKYEEGLNEFYPLHFTIYRSRFFGIGKKEMYSNVLFYNYYNYLILYRYFDRGRDFNYLWYNRIREKYLI